MCPLQVRGIRICPLQVRGVRMGPLQLRGVRMDPLQVRGVRMVRKTHVCVYTLLLICVFCLTIL